MLPEHRPAQATHPHYAVPSATPDAVDRILSYTDTAIASIVRRTEHQVREIAAQADARSAGEAMQRRAELTELRRELTERASALAIQYEAILDQLETAEAALGVWAGQEAPPGAEPLDPRVDAIKMTLRERQRISFAYEESLPPPAPVYQMPTQPAVAVGEAQAPRRWWHRRHREAA